MRIGTLGVAAVRPEPGMMHAEEALTRTRPGPWPQLPNPVLSLNHSTAPPLNALLRQP
jgi:hypothetical protein